MTCIAFDGRYLAADSALFRGDNSMTTNVDKLFIRWEKGNEFAFALCGTKLHLNKLHDYLKKDKYFEFDNTGAGYDVSCTCGLIVSADFHKNAYAQFIYADGSIDPQKFTSIADGSGSVFLMGCLAAGTSAMKAVHLAKFHTTAAGGDVKYIDCLRMFKHNEFEIKTYIPQN